MPRGRRETQGRRVRALLSPGPRPALTLLLALALAAVAHAAGWILGGLYNATTTVIPRTEVVVRQPRESDHVLYQDRETRLLAVCSGNDRYLIIDFGNAFNAHFQSGACGVGEVH